ncbi:MAG: outer membrane protein assembly factor BamB family protein, partial [Planctomycetota bacterium]
DLAFEPVVSRGLVFFGSSSDCTVYALEAETGRKKWTYATDGPVRFAPAVWQDRLFVVSDDGYLYCLAAGDGKLLWKKGGGPDPDMVLGNDRLISRWPARGGPVIRGGVGHLVLDQPHGGNRARSGVSIQGYLAIAGNSLVVPTGRAGPAVFEGESGQFRYFHLMKLGAGWGRRKGAGPFVTFIDENLFIVEDDVFQASDGRFLARGLPVSSTAVLPEMLVFTRGHEIRAIRKSSLWIEEKDPNGLPVRKLSLDDIAWSIACSDPVGASVVRATASNEAPDWPDATQLANPPLVVAGRTIVAATLNGKIVTADTESRTVVTTTELDGLALGLAVAERALYVGTDKGTIYCFVPAEGDEAGRPDDRRVRPEPYRIKRPYRRMAREIIKEADLREGYCVDLACGDGALAHALAGASQLRIIAIDQDPRRVALARKKLSEAGLYGTRVTVLQRDPSATGLPSRFAQLVVSGRSVTEGRRAAPAEEIRRLLHPYGGVGRTVGRPPAGAGEWTHQYADAANTLCSADDLARSPLKMRWFTDFGIRMPSRHGRGPAPLSKNGVMIIEALDGLLGVDAYSGRRLWFYGMENILGPYDQEHLLGTSGTGSNMCLADDSVLVRRGGRCLRINMRTGTLVREYTMPDRDGTWGFIACDGGILYGTSADRTYVVRQLFRDVSNMENLLTQSRSLFALDIKTGKTRWIYEARASIRHNAIAIGGGRVYLIDKPKHLVDLPAKDEADANAPAEPPETPEPSRLICLDAGTGSILWEQSTDIYGTTLAASSEHNVLLMSYQYAQRSFQLPSERGDRLTGFRTTDGKRLWDTHERYISRPIINGTTIYAQPYSFDLLTGLRNPGFELADRQPGGCGPMTGSR